MKPTPITPAQDYLDAPGQPRRVRVTCPICQYPHTYAAPRYRATSTANQLCNITGELITITGLGRTS